MSQHQALDARTRALQQASTQLVLRHQEDPKQDIAAERARATFPVQELLYHLNGGKEKVQKRAKFAEVLANTPWGDKTRRHFLTREEEYVGGLQAALGIWQKMQAEKLTLEDGLMMRSLVDFPGGLELHIGMFIPTILSQASPEQQAAWMPACLSLQIIGTYAQTELGHGTFVRGLETTATYDPQTQEFILHSPTLTSTKWWPGGMGKTATHAVVMARLLLGGKDYGPHAFLVQLRSLEDHRPLPGIEVGDIGPKYGYNGVDNGFMRMDHVRIARDKMFSRFAQVTPEGTYVPPPPANSKASYATMVYVRADIVKNAGGVLAKATTIATRYAAVRRQTAPSPGARELQVLDYQNCAATLLPLVSSAYALWFMGEHMMAMYTQFEADRDRGEFSALPELHALSSGLKAVCTWVTAGGIEECRRTCGGHGYSKLSGLPTLFQNYVQNVTWEGDNNVLCLQTARYLHKQLAAAAGGKPVAGSAAYLTNLQQQLSSRCGVSSPAGWSPQQVLAALQHRAARLAVGARDALLGANQGKLVYEGPGWNSVTVEQIRLARAHCETVLLSTFMGTVADLATAGSKPGGSMAASSSSSGASGSPSSSSGVAAQQLSGATLAVLQRLCRLFGLTLLEGGLAELLEGGYLTGSQAASVRAAQRQLLVELRPDAVALVDAFGFEDYALHSALGRADGNVYAALLAMAKGSPLNASQEGPAWEGVLRPVMQRKPAPKL